MPTEGSNPELWEAGTFTRFDNPSKSEEVDLSQIFPNGYISLNITSHPVSGSPLTHSYCLFIDNFSGRTKHNTSIKRMLGCDWIGPIVAFKFNSASHTSRRGLYSHMKKKDLDYFLPILGE